MDPQCRGRLVEGVEVDAVHLAIEKVTALLGGPVHADVADGFIVTFLSSVDRPKERGWKHRSGRQ